MFSVFLSCTEANAVQANLYSSIVDTTSLFPLIGLTTLLEENEIGIFEAFTKKPYKLVELSPK